MDIKDLTETEIIAKLFNQIKVQSDFYKYAAPKLGISVSTLRINWFHLGSFPEAKKSALINVMGDYLKQQKSI